MYNFLFYHGRNRYHWNYLSLLQNVASEISDGECQRSTMMMINIHTISTSTNTDNNNDDQNMDGQSYHVTKKDV